MTKINTEIITDCMCTIKSESTKIEGKKVSFAPGAFNSSASGKLTSAISNVTNSYSEISNKLKDLCAYLKNYSSDSEGEENMMSDGNGTVLDDAVYAVINNYRDVLKKFSMGLSTFTSQTDMSTDNTEENQKSRKLPNGYISAFGGILNNLKSKSDVIQDMKNEISGYIASDKNAYNNNRDLLAGVVLGFYNFFKPAEKKGTVSEIKTFTSRMTYGGKNVGVGYSVYTPPNYDPSKKYNIAIIFDGLNNNNYGNSFFTSNVTAIISGKSVYRQSTDVFDNFFNDNENNNTILVTLDYNKYNRDNPDSNGETAFHYDLMHTLLPTIAQDYSTYIDPNDTSSIIENRDHALLGGYSLGGRYAVNKSPEVLDIFGNFAYISAEELAKPENLVKAINNSNYPIRSMFFGTGTGEFGNGNHNFNIPATVLTGCSDKLTYGENFVYCVSGTYKDENTIGYGHDRTNAIFNTIKAISYAFGE